MKVKSMRGVEVDMGALAAKHENVIAVGNANMNARGDVIGRGGKIIKSRDDIAQEYYRNNPKAVRKIALKDLTSEVMGGAALGSEKLDMDFPDPVAAVETLTAAKAKKPRKIEDTDE